MSRVGQVPFTSTARSADGHDSETNPNKIVFIKFSLRKLPVKKDIVRLMYRSNCLEVASPHARGQGGMADVVLVCLVISSVRAGCE